MKKKDNIILINPGSPNKPIKTKPTIAILTINEKQKHKNKIDKVQTEFIKIIEK